MIKGIPPYVWAILAYLLYLGVKSTKTRIVYLPRLFMTPLVLLAIKYEIFFSEDGVVFGFAMALGTAVSFVVYRGGKAEAIKGTWTMKIPGSHNVLLVSFSFFVAKFCFGYLKSVDPGLAFKYSVVESVASGLFSGYFMGRALRYIHRYLKN